MECDVEAYQGNGLDFKQNKSEGLKAKLYPA